MPKFLERRIPLKVEAIKASLLEGYPEAIRLFWGQGTVLAGKNGEMLISVTPKIKRLHAEIS